MWNFKESFLGLKICKGCNAILWSFQGWSFVLSRISRGKVKNLKIPGGFQKSMSSTPSQKRNWNYLLLYDSLRHEFKFFLNHRLKPISKQPTFKWTPILFSQPTENMLLLRPIGRIFAFFNVTLCNYIIQYYSNMFTHHGLLQRDDDKKHEN